jgi:hypothetical protein
MLPNVSLPLSHNSCRYKQVYQFESEWFSLYKVDRVDEKPKIKTLPQILFLRKLRAV